MGASQRLSSRCCTSASSHDALPAVERPRARRARCPGGGSAGRSGGPRRFFGLFGAADDTGQDRKYLGVHRRSYSGMLPCFLAGSDSLLPRISCSAATSRARFRPGG